MNDLTEQWKKGELPNGWYWVDYYSVDGAVMLEYIPQHNGFGYEEKELVQAVLAPVPSYEELQNINKSVNNLMATNIKLVEENKQLKELLKECKDVAEFTKTIVNKHKWLDGVISKISQALGEDK